MQMNILTIKSYMNRITFYVNQSSVFILDDTFISTTVRCVGLDNHITWWNDFVIFIWWWCCQSNEFPTILQKPNIEVTRWYVFLYFYSTPVQNEAGTCFATFTDDSDIGQQFEVFYKKMETKKIKSNRKKMESCQNMVEVVL